MWSVPVMQIQIDGKLATLDDDRSWCCIQSIDQLAVELSLGRKLCHVSDPVVQVRPARSENLSSRQNLKALLECSHQCKTQLGSISSKSDNVL